MGLFQRMTYKKERQAPYNGTPTAPQNYNKIPYKQHLNEKKK